MNLVHGGRYKEIYIQSLSYKEFLLFHNLYDSDDSLAKYIQFGGLPGLAKIGLDEDDAVEYQKDVFNTVLLKDVIFRNKIRNIVFLENLTNFIADNIGKLISANNISKYMKLQGDKISSDTVINYAKYLEDAYIIHKVNRYDIHGFMANGYLKVMINSISKIMVFVTQLSGEQERETLKKSLKI